MEQGDKHSYLREMLLSQGNVYAFLGAVASGALLSIPYGFGVGLLPVIGFVAGETIAAMYIPGSEGFRAKVDKKYRERARETTRNHLLEEIGRRGKSSKAGTGSVESYERMVKRVESLYSIAKDRYTRLSAHDVERLDEATVDYLCMWVAALVIEEREKAVSIKDIEMRLQAIEHELSEPKPGVDLAQLQKARNEYLSLMTRHRRMMSRKTAIDAAMLSMPDQMDEIYQAIVTAPTSAEVDSKLAESIEKICLEEGIEAELEAALGEMASDFSARRGGQQPSRMKQSSQK